MKKIFILAMSLFIAVASMAQESNRTANGKIQYGPYETNKFWDNWFVEAGAGVNVPIDNVTALFDGGMTGDFGGLAVVANVGKWIDPCYGVRVGWYGLTSGDLNNPITFKDSFNGDHAFNYVHGDFMLNFSNLVAGYKEKRAINVVPYLTAGAAWREWDTNRSFALGGGIQAPIRVSNRVNIVPEVQVLALNSRVVGGDHIVGNASADVAIRVNLGRTNWTRKATTVAYYEELGKDYLNRLREADNIIAKLNGENADLENTNKDLQKNINALNDANAQLRKQLEDCENSTYGDKYVAYFEIGKDTLSEKEIAHFVNFFNDFMNDDTKVTIHVAGSTDSGTGSARRNAALREARAKYVANLFKTRYGVDAQIVEGGIEDFDVPALSRAAVVSWE